MSCQKKKASPMCLSPSAYMLANISIQDLSQDRDVCSTRSLTCSRSTSRLCPCDDENCTPDLCGKLNNHPCPMQVTNVPTKTSVPKCEMSNCQAMLRKLAEEAQSYNSNFSELDKRVSILEPQSSCTLTSCAVASTPKCAKCASIPKCPSILKCVSNLKYPNTPKCAKSASDPKCPSIQKCPSKCPSKCASKCSSSTILKKSPRPSCTMLSLAKKTCCDKQMCLESSKLMGSICRYPTPQKEKDVCSKASCTRNSKENVSVCTSNTEQSGSQTDWGCNTQCSPQMRAMPLAAPIPRRKSSGCIAYNSCQQFAKLSKNDKNEHKKKIKEDRRRMKEEKKRLKEEQKRMKGEMKLKKNQNNTDSLTGLCINTNCIANASCSCHFPPAFSQFYNCTGQINGNCDCAGNN